MKVVQNTWFRQLLLRSHSTSRLDILRQRLDTETEIKFPSTTSGEIPDSLPGNGRLPEWLKSPIPTGHKFTNLKNTLRELDLHTVLDTQLAAPELFRCVKKLNVRILVNVGVVGRRGRLQQR